MDNTDKIVIGCFLAVVVLVAGAVAYDYGERKACSALGGAYISGVCLDVNTITLEK